MVDDAVIESMEEELEDVVAESSGTTGVSALHAASNPSVSAMEPREAIFFITKWVKVESDSSPVERERPE